MRRLILILLVMALITVAGCGTKIADIKENTGDYLGKEIAITGKAVQTVKLGELSGFTLKQDDESITVMSQEIPKEGDTVTVKGSVSKGLIGTYIQAYDVK
ncbi:MAG: hypothetical protein KJ574_01875 [Nanoarchaeota archaeon]|nr:hypothetical protein [Nanoarchaeota archaeon]